MKTRLDLALITGLYSLTIASAVPVTFEDAPLGNPGTDGSTEYNSSGRYYWNGSDASGSFTSGGATFPNTFTDWGGGSTSWAGFAYSNTTDTTTGAYSNQYSAIAGSGQGGSSTYAVSYASPSPTLTFDSAFDFTSGKGMYLTNTTLTALDMQNGSAFSKVFGGASGTDPDWLRITIDGKNGGASTGSVDFYLADFRSANSAEDYILTSWTFVDLSSLGSVDQLDFSMSSSDNGSFGMNTPAYFALDSIGVIPEASTLASLLFGALLLIHVLRRRRS